VTQPEVVRRIRERAVDLGFDASCSDTAGRLLTTLAASKPDGRLLELGTGAGLGTAYLLEGMTTSATLTTVELEGSLSTMAREELDDPRVEWVVGDGGAWLDAQTGAGGGYDLVFADTWPGKFTHLEQCLRLVAPGGWYVVDDLQRQSTWPAHHAAAVDQLVDVLTARPGWRSCRLDVGTGIMVCVRAS